MKQGSRAAADREDPSTSTAANATGTRQAADREFSDYPSLRNVATGNPAIAADPFLVDSPGPGSPHVLGSFAFGAQHSRPSTADTSGIG
jgi:hypothetical protein